MTFKKILETVVAYYDIEIKDICGAKRDQNLVKARQIVCYLARKELNQSYPSIGRELGGRDHTTALHAARKIASDIHENEKLSHEVDIILKLIKEDSGYIERHIEKKEEEHKEIKKRNLVIDIKKLSKNNLSLKQQRRQEEILNQYQGGSTFAEIAKKYHLTRERIRQITERALLYRAQELLNRDPECNPEKFLKEERHKHLLRMQEKHGIPKKRPVVEKEKRWSRYYDHCRKCATRIIKHHSYGYCRRCYPKTELFKSIQKKSRLRNIRKRRERERDYYKRYRERPEVIARARREADLKYFGGNREKAIQASDNRCSVCGISREESQIKYNRDLFVLHLAGKNNNELKDLKVVCRGCFQAKVQQNEISFDYNSGTRIKISTESLLGTVANYYGISIANIIGKSRKKNFVIARMTAVFLMRNKLGISSVKIGHILGGRDHTTIAYSYKKISKDYNKNEKIKKDIENIIKKLIDR